MVLIFGNGYVGNLLKRFYGDEAILTTADISNEEEVERALSTYKSDYVINAAGKTGKPNVDWCETNRKATFKSNVYGPLVLAEACYKKNIDWMHIGSGCVFYGDLPRPSGWKETDLADPLSFYSKTKYAADMLLSHYNNVTTVRIRMPISGEASDRNLLCKLSKYERIVNARNSVSVLEDCIPAMDSLRKSGVKGMFNLTNSGSITHEEIVSIIKKYKIDFNPELITLEKFESSGLVKAARSNAVLDTSKLESLGIRLPEAAHSIDKCARSIWG